MFTTLPQSLFPSSPVRIPLKIEEAGDLKRHKKRNFDQYGVQNYRSVCAITIVCKLFGYFCQVLVHYHTLRIEKPDAVFETKSFIWRLLKLPKMYKSLQAVEMVQWSVWLLPTRMTLGPKPLLKSVNKDQKRSWFAHLE